MCNCHSYNKDEPNSGKMPPMVVMTPDEFDSENEFISIDYCIHETILHLWANGIITMNSCCGHNKESPSIVLQDSIDNESIVKIRELIASIDNREYKLFSWKLCEV